MFSCISLPKRQHQFTYKAGSRSHVYASDIAAGAAETAYRPVVMAQIQRAYEQTTLEDSGKTASVTSSRQLIALLIFILGFPTILCCC